MIRLHIPGIPYTITRSEYSNDPFTNKVRIFSPMMRSRGFEVYHYGIETSEAGANKNFDLMTKDEWNELRVKSLQYLDPKLSLEDARGQVASSYVIGSLMNWSTPLSKEFNKRFREKLIENYRGKTTDIVCIPFGKMHNDAIDKLDCVPVEIGVGFAGSYLNFRVFESYAWMSKTLGLENKQPNNYWFVIPHAYNSDEFKLSLISNLNTNTQTQRFGYMGRITSAKGCGIIVEIAKRFPHIEFVLCGPGDPTPFLKFPNIIYKPSIHGLERSDFLGSCTGFLHLAKYFEPFGCGPVEAQLCGTPVICSDWGGMTETVENFKTGLRCHTLSDYCKGVQMAIDGFFDRRYIRQRAVNLYDMHNLSVSYEYVFKTILDMYKPGKNGWYSPDTHIVPFVKNISMSPQSSMVMRNTTVEKIMTNSKIRLHIPGIPCTITRNEYSHDAYTGKVQRFSPMMRSRGFEVYHYGIETSEAGANKNFDLMTKDEWNELRIKSLQYLDPKLSLEDAKKKSESAYVIQDLMNWSTPLSKEFNKRFRAKLIENYRGKTTDIVCLPLGKMNKAAIDDFNCVSVETGIGYSDSYLDFRVFESYAWMSKTLGIENKQPSNYWFVVPNYFDIQEFKLTLKPTPLKIGFLGRICSVKGCGIIAEIAKRFPHVQFILCGSGEPTEFLRSPNIIYKAPIHGPERSDYLGSCVAVLCLSKFLEPFCGVAVEAQLCGTPVICSDWGGMAETVEHGKTGLKGHTIADYCYGVQLALDGKFDREYIRNRAVKLFDMYNLAYNYEYIFKSLIDMYTPGKNGWYSPDTHIQELIENTSQLSNSKYIEAPKENSEKKIRLHIPAIPYTITRDEYSHDAFTNKVKLFSPMMRSVGFEVYHYGVETSNSNATKQIDIMTKEEWTELRIKSWQFLDNKLSYEEAKLKNSDPTQVISQLSNWSSPLTKEFNSRFRKHLIENYRSSMTDIVCIPLSKTYEEALDKLAYVVVEHGIGYDGSRLGYRIFESHLWMSRTLGVEDKQPQNYWFVIPHAFDTKEFTLSLKPEPKKVGFLGRITNLKGCGIIKEIARRFPDVQFILCGQGDHKPYTDIPNVVYKPPIHGKERSDFLGSCVAFLHLAKYLEPFGCGPVEAQLCGTPVICSDWGGMVETVEQGTTGLRGHTLADYCYGVKMALDGKFDRQYIRDRAVRLYDMYNLAKQYDYALKSILSIHNYSGGWYSPFTYIEPLIENKVNNINFKNGGECYKNEVSREVEGVPHIFFQTSKDALPNYIYRMIKRHLSEDWEYRHFTDDSIIQFFNENPLEDFPDIINIFKSFKKGCHRADIFRYYFLYINGGVFMDSDAMIYKDIDLIIKNNSFVSVISQNRRSLFNGIIATSKKNPIIKEALDLCYSTLPSVMENDYHYWTTALYNIVKKNQYNYELYIESCPFNGITDTCDNDGNILFKHYWNKKIVPEECYVLGNLNVDMIYYINLDRREDRNINILKQFEKHNIPSHLIKRFTAIDGTTYNFNNDELNLFRNSDFINKPFSKKIMGNQLSHFTIYKEMLDKNYKKILILQDDSIFRDNLIFHLNNVLNSLPSDTEVLNIGMHDYANLNKFRAYDLTSENDYQRIEKNKINEHVSIWKDNIQPCSLSYILTCDGARNIIKHFEQHGFPCATDVSLNRYLISKKIFYGSRKILCTGDPSFGTDIFDVL